MNNKKLIAICSIIFIFVTAFVLSLDNQTQFRRVKFTNQNLEITHENTQITNQESVKLHNNNSKLQNKEIPTTNKNIELSDTGKLTNQPINIKDDSYYSRLETHFDNNSKEVTTNDTKTKYPSLEELDKLINNAKNKQQQKEQDKYAYANLDWNTWHSNFVNKILDDSMNIRELDQYNDGAWFYYSFVVHRNGAISNISVKSMYLKQSDKEKLAQFIKSYQYKSITRFPLGSKRESAKVSAIMMLSNSSQYATPKDFSDGEQIKIKL